MIDITRDGTKVSVRVEAPPPIADHSFVLTWDAGNEWAAKLLIAALRAAMYDRLAAIREHAYAEGWKHAKSKKTRKQTWFARSWRVDV